MPGRPAAPSRLPELHVIVATLLLYVARTFTYILLTLSVSLFLTRFACEDLNADAAKSIRPTNKREEAQQLFAICRLTGSNEKILEEREISLELLIKLFLILKILNFSIKPFHKTLFYAYIDLTIGLYLSFYKISQENSTCCSLT